MKYLGQIIAITIIILSSLINQQLYSQCDAVLDQKQEVFNLGTWGADQWQSFTPAISGRLSKIQLFHNGRQVINFTLTIYEGDGTGGPVLFSKFYDYGEMVSQWFDINIPTSDAPQLTSGNKYTMRIEGVGTGFVCYNPGNYPEGNYWSNVYGQQNWDLMFRTYSIPNFLCGEVVDQKQENHNLGTFGADQWQSFKSGKSGKLTKLQLFHNGCIDLNFTLSIYSGTGTGGTLLFTKFYNYGYMCAQWFDISLPLNEAPSLVNGSTYTFRIQGNGTYFTVTNPGQYGDGVYWSSSYGSTPWDLTFRTYITKYDTDPPVAQCKSALLNLGANGIATLTSSNVNNNSYDDCSIKTMSVTPNTFDCSDISIDPSTVVIPPVVVKYPAGRTVTYSNVNINSDGGKVTVEPGATVNVTLSWLSQYTSDYCPYCVQQYMVGVNGIVSSCLYSGSTNSTVSGTGNFSFTAPTVPGVYYIHDRSSLDWSCSGSTSYATTMEGALGAVIVAPKVTLTVEDNACRTSSCETFVYIQDKLAPTVVTKNFTTHLDLNGNATITPAYINNGSTDNCSIKSMVLDKSTFDCSNVGNNTVNLTVTDNYGNSATKSAIVTIKDITPPVVKTKPVTIYLNSSGVATLTAQDVDDGTSDLCELKSIAISKTTFNCQNLGVNTIVFSAYDESNNVATQNVQVTVVDNIAPVAICKTSTLVLDNDGIGELLPGMVNNSSTDNCGIATMSVTPNIFDCSNVCKDPANITINSPVVRSYAGRNVTFSNVTINNSGNKLLVNPGSTVTLSLNWSSVYASNYCPGCIQQYYVGISGVFDECLYSGNTSFNVSGSRTVSFTAPTTPGTYYIQTNSSLQYNCVGMGYSNTSDYAIGVIVVAPEVTLTVKDASGNESSCKTFIFIEDNTPPTVITKPYTAFLNNNGTASIVVGDVDNNSADACGIQSMTLDKTDFNCTNLGNNQISLKVIDKNGNENTAIANVLVKDEIPPVAIAKNLTIYLNASGEALIPVVDINNGSYDNCGIANMWVDKPSLNCNNKGNNTITLFVKDNSENVASATAVVTVIDNIPPKAIAKNIQVLLNSYGYIDINPSSLNNGSFDNCGIANISANKTRFDCSNIGQNQVIMTVTDYSGMTSSATAVVEILDRTAPTVITKNITVFLNNNGVVNISAQDVNYGSYDACGIAYLFLDKSSFSCSNLGLNQVVLTAIDNSGNVASKIASVYVVDNIPPTIITKSVTKYLDASGRTTVTQADIDNGSFDNCGIVSYTISPNTFSCSDAGRNILVTVTARDSYGNTSYRSAEVQIRDNIAPTARTQNITVYLNDGGYASISPSSINYNSYDNCGIANMSLNKSTFYCNNVGTNEVVLTVWDYSGNSSSAVAYVTVKDYNRPIVRTKNITVFLNSSGVVNITPDQINYNSYDACGIANMYLDRTTFYCNNIGNNSVLLTVVDVNGNSASAYGVVTVIDNTPPAVITKNIQVILNPSGYFDIMPSSLNNGSYDNCGINSFSANRTRFYCSDVGYNQVILTATDNSGNTSSATAIVQVLDNTVPTVVIRNITVYLNSNGVVNITPQDVNNGSYDACGIAYLLLDKSSFNCSNLGYNQVVLTAIDNHGNVASKVASVYVVDNIPPTIITKSVTKYLDETGRTVVTPSDINNGSYDNCSIVEFFVSPNTFSCQEAGRSVWVNLIARDSYGNTSSRTAEVFIRDNTPPVVRTKDAIVQLNDYGFAPINYSTINNGSYDNCGISYISIDKTEFRCNHIGVNEVTLTVRDIWGNVASAKAYVTVQDNVKPRVYTRNVTLELNANGEASLTPEQINNGTWDACGIASISLNKTNFDCSNLGANNVLLTATDINGNTATAGASVYIIDRIVPTVITKNINVYLDENGLASITPNDINNGSYDNCTIREFNVSQNTFNCTALGQTIPVLLKATDQSGNISMATSYVTVYDEINPTSICKNIEIKLDARGKAVITPEDINNGSFDNCSIIDMSISQSEFMCENVGPNEITLTVTDLAGNQSTCTSIVLVIEDIAPTAICQDLTVYLDQTGTVDITVNDINNGSFDNCSIANIELDKYSFDCYNHGTNEVIMTVTDVNNNVSICKSNVMVLDEIPPVVLTKDLTIQLDEYGMAYITTNDINNGSYDNCNISNITLDKTEFDCDNLGDNVVVLTVTDIFGNSASANAIVTVTDNILPIIAVTVTPTTLWPANHKMQTISATVTSDDNCGSSVYLKSITSSEADNGLGDGDTPNDIQNASFGTADFSFDLRKERSGTNKAGRTYTIVYAVVDGAGNETTATAYVYVPFSQKKEIPFEEEITLFSGAKLEVYPNPTADIVNINFLSEINGDIDLRLMNLSGAELISFSKNSVKAYDNVLNLSDYPAGTYLLEVKFNYEVKIIKIIKY